MFDYRQATPADLPQLLKLEQAVIDAERPFNTTIKDQEAKYYDIEALINNDDSLMQVVEFNDVIIATGYVQIRESKVSLKHKNHGYLGFMYVEPVHRGKGINKQVMQKLIT